MVAATVSPLFANPFGFAAGGFPLGEGGWASGPRNPKSDAEAKVAGRSDFGTWLVNCRIAALLPALRGTDFDYSGATNVDELHVASATGRQAQQILELTRRLFPPGPIQVQCERDPEETDNEYLAVDVLSSADVREVLALHSTWHEEVGKIIPGDTSWLRLCIYPR